MANELKKKPKKTGSEKFMNNVITQFEAEAGNEIVISDYERALAQHLFLKLDSVLKEAETKRQNNPKKRDAAPFVWDNINMRKLALDSVHTVMLGLDALIPNHIHPITYWNSREKKYDVDLRPGYIGKAYYREQSAVSQPEDIIYELVYESDHFIPKKRNLNSMHDSYEFDIKKPFERGNIIGGFGYIIYPEDSGKGNELVLVSRADFEKSKSYAQSPVFWRDHFEEMCFKTLVHRTTEKIQVDPRKVNSAYLAMENKEDEDAPIKKAESVSEVQEEIDYNANSIDVDFEDVEEDEESPGKTPKEMSKDHIEETQQEQKNVEPINQEQERLFDNLSDLDAPGY